MDERGWMYVASSNDSFVNGVDSFVNVARSYQTSDGYQYCLCIDCKNQKQFQNIEQIRRHLLCRGFMANYRVWNKHGEEGENEATQPNVVDKLRKTFQEATRGENEATQPNDTGNVDHGSFMDNFAETLADDDVMDGIDQMIRDGEPECLDAKNLKKLEQMRQDAKTPLYHGCSMSKLQADLLLLELKSSYGLSDTGFDSLLDLMGKMLPSPNGLPKNTYEA